MFGPERQSNTLFDSVVVAAVVAVVVVFAITVRHGFPRDVSSRRPRPEVLLLPLVAQDGEAKQIERLRLTPPLRTSDSIHSDCRFI